MKKHKMIKVIYKNEKTAESDKKLDEIYNFIFSKVIEDIIKDKKN
jgi:hypothetical protein